MQLVAPSCSINHSMSMKSTACSNFETWTINL